jgi:hypothetical protein
VEEEDCVRSDGQLVSFGGSNRFFEEMNKHLRGSASKSSTRQASSKGRAGGQATGTSVKRKMGTRATNGRPPETLPT